ncbi:MAG: hypothetical protein CVU56_20935 [Deltaproteobacteria bacterium HGW-Deltaproteobacteria-14]|jgi:ribosomal protein L37AE/L43A|nr:MAG: hypothetical protein CVU56_20935 [Deltaproteobacteria bacterium HGW-Deltaproteobacteria-14]
MGIGAWLKRIFGGSEGEGGDDSCVACGSSALTALADGVYRCDECGYEGGDGFAAWRTERDKEALRELSPSALRARAVKALEGARLTLVAAAGGAEGGSDSGWKFTLSVGDGAALANVDAQEAARMARERRAGVAKARSEALAAIPIFEVLAEEGQGEPGLLPHLQRLRDLEQTDPAEPSALASIIGGAGAALSG